MSNSLVYTICLFKLYSGTSYGEKTYPEMIPYRMPQRLDGVRALFPKIQFGFHPDETILME